MRANPLTADLGVARDGLGRVPVDDYLRVDGVHDVFAAGDVAAARMDDTHMSVMSCQHGRPMGRFAGYNVVSDLLGEPMLALRIPWYVTVLDLGPAGAVYTEGWERQVVASGGRSKSHQADHQHAANLSTAQRDRDEILAAAAPTLQSRPSQLAERAGAASTRSAGSCRTCPRCKSSSASTSSDLEFITNGP